MKRYDLIVIGAGPAGLMAARAAAESGLDVICLEKKPEPTQLKRACGQTLVSMNEYLFRNLCQFNSRDKRVSFSTDGFSFKYDGPYLNLCAVYSYVENGHFMQLGIPSEQRKKGNAGMVALAIDKEVLIKCMIDELLDYHGEIRSNTDVEDIQPYKEGVKVIAGGQVFDASYVIGADGTNSKVAAKLSFNKDRDYYCNLYALSHYVSGLETPEPDVLFRLSQFIPGGYAALFVIPRPDGSFNTIVITIDPKLDLKQAFDYFSKKSVFAPWFKRAEIGESFSAVCNSYAAIQSPFKDRVLIAGDAASTQELENTGAIISGWKAGQAVTTAIIEEKTGCQVTGIQQYLDWWSSCYLKEHNPEVYIKSFAMPMILPSNEEINYFFSLINEPLPACYNPYSSPTARVMKQIYTSLQNERPDILAKMQRRSLPAKELFEPIAKISKPV